ncbi:terpenoid cyclases/Protein prenyltransferase [Ascodesmis nigricans]|uniref:Protein farnesyltransferase subunit beta n=1 Tax=Ascodesmis nigricans TaxID=341454 RepID=A0A4S2N4F5_9PEZI|nr:terpenoid cyclases/Protein prenyltransferase [Ascodesmis nigricans]
MSTSSPASTSKPNSSSTSTSSTRQNRPRRSTKPRVVFPRRTMPPSNTPSPQTTDYNPSFNPSTSLPPPPPPYQSRLPLLKDIYRTLTSTLQTETANRILTFLVNPRTSFPQLDRASHTHFLLNGFESLPPYMTALDASRPWIIYWCLSALAILGHDTSRWRDRIISSLRPLQNPAGGFGGGNGQLSHLAPTYAAVLSLVLAGGNALDLVDRGAMTRWLHSLKKPDGSFSVCENGECDVRGLYCALTVITILRLPTDGGLLDGCLDFLSACQTYEGGFAANPYGAEAHGGYAFCALAGLACLLTPGEMAKRVKIKEVIRWLSSLQYAPEGGFAGRTNKLVDGCYSTWVGGCWAFVEAAIQAEENENKPKQSPQKQPLPTSSTTAPDAEKLASTLASTTLSPDDTDPPTLWSHQALTRYILACCQSPQGGLRDKPGKGPDFYHSNYVLMGLSAAQYRWTYDPSLLSEDIAPDGHEYTPPHTHTHTHSPNPTTSSSDPPTSTGAQDTSPGPAPVPAAVTVEETPAHTRTTKAVEENVVAPPWHWTWDDYPNVFPEAEEWPVNRYWDGENDEVLPVHPVFCVVASKAEEAREWGEKVLAGGEGERE